MSRSFSVDIYRKLWSKNYKNWQKTLNFQATWYPETSQSIFASSLPCQTDLDNKNLWQNLLDSRWNLLKLKSPSIDLPFIKIKAYKSVKTDALKMNLKFKFERCDYSQLTALTSVNLFVIFRQFWLLSDKVPH